MTMKYTEATAAGTVVSTELNSLADDAAALASAAIENGDSTNRYTHANFSISLAAQGSARAADAQVSLLIVPDVGGSVFGDVATLKTAQNGVARDSFGNAMTFSLDAATTARVITLANVVLPNGNFKVGLLNESGQALGASANTIAMTGKFGFTNV